MTLSEFIDNLADLNDGENFSRDLLSKIYYCIQDEPVEFDLLVKTFSSAYYQIIEKCMFYYCGTEYQ